MILIRKSRSALTLILSTGLATLSWIGTAQSVRTQGIPLQEGWNAIFLEVEPLTVAPDQLLTRTPIDRVARYLTPTTPIQFISDPDSESWKRAEWGIWYSPLRDDAFLTDLHRITGNKCYLIHALEAFDWEVTGTVTYAETKWVAGSYNLVGFSVDPHNPPTFSEYFKGAGERIGQRIFRLENQKWKLVTDPASTPIRPGEACWVYCEGRTDFQGPMAVKVSGIDRLDFGRSAGILDLRILNNHTGHERVRLEWMEQAGGLPLFEVNRDLSTLKTSWNPIHTLPAFRTIAGNGTLTIRLGLRRPRDRWDPGSVLLKLTSDGGSQKWISIDASTPQSADSTHSAQR